MEEVWKSVVGYEGWYEVSNMGRVRRAAPGRNSSVGKILKPKCSNGTRGYHMVNLSVGGVQYARSVHKLVARTFMGMPPEGKEINHIDGDKANNSLSNLEYVTKCENMRHALRLGLRNLPKGSDCYIAKLTEEKVQEMYRLHLSGISCDRLAKMYGVAQSSVYRAIVSRKSWRHVNLEG